MNEKKDLGRLGLCILLFFILFGSFVIIVDPFYHYHEPWLNIPVILDNAVYQTAGAARNLEYDSAIIGTSMTENMRTSWYDEELGWNTMKLSYSGARSNDLQAIFEEVAQNDGELKNVVMDINAYQLTSESWTSYVERPEYLYDEYLHNDYQYVYNHDLFVLSISRSLDGLMGVENNIDTAYTWEDESLFGKEIALDSCRDTREQLLVQKETEANPYMVTGKTTDKLEQCLQICQENLNNILPYIEGHPETEFYIMVPPYSMLYWEQEVLKGELENTIAVYEYALKNLLSHDNVNLYYFQNEKDIITNLDNYRDNAHHAPEFNKYMFECMRDGKNLLNLENYKQELEEMYLFARDFPYESLWVE